MATPVALVDPHSRKPLQRYDDGLGASTGRRFPLRDGIYRFVEQEGYTASFGLQWNRYPTTQLDRFRDGYRQGRDRFFAATGWQCEDLKEARILEAGSGAGRFTQVVLEHTEAELYSVDSSSAVDANWRNNGPHERLHLFQASIYALPFAEGQFDKVFCFGVLQHTPDPRRTVECLSRMVAPGGELVVDFYAVLHWYSKLQVKYLLRPLTKRMDPERLLRLIDANVGLLIAAQRFTKRIGIGKIAKRLLPLCDVEETLPPDLDEATLREWAVLDTFDMFSPWYDRPQRIDTVVRWFLELGLVDVRGRVVSYGQNHRVPVVRGIRSPDAGGRDFEDEGAPSSGDRAAPAAS